MSIKANITLHNIEEKNINRDKPFKCRQITKNIRRTNLAYKMEFYA